MKHRPALSIIAAVLLLLLLAGCGSSPATRHRPQPSDTLLTVERVMDAYADDKQQALLIIDSAQAAGHLSAERADLLRATVYGRTTDAPRHDSAVVIGERLLGAKAFVADAAFRQNVLEVLVYSTRQLEDYELQLVYSTQLADAYRQQGDRVEALRTEAEVGAVLYRLGRTDEGLARMDSVVRVLAPVRRFNELDASIIAMKRKIGVIRDYRQIAEEAQRLLDRLEDYEQHPAPFHDGSLREPSDESRPGYIAFYRAQAWMYLAAAYAHLGQPQQSRHFLSLAGQSDFGQTLAGKKMMAPTLCQLGEYGKMETVYQELETVFVQRGDTLTLDYAQLLLDRAKAAQGQGRTAESIALWEKHAQVLQKAEERLLRGKANLYAARFHAQEQQMAIARQQDELARRNIVNVVLAIGLAVLLVVVAYVLRQQRILRLKNSVLAREIAEAIGYRDKFAAMMALRQQAPAPLPDADSQGAPADEQLFLHIRDVVMRDQLFLDPMLNRQKLTDLLSLTKEQLGAAFSKGSSYSSVTDFINDCRLPYAAKLLAERPELSIAEVAQASGFARAATFSTNFKKKFALTPNQYREQVRQTALQLPEFYTGEASKREQGEGKT